LQLYDRLFDDVLADDSVFADKSLLDPLAEPEEIVPRTDREQALARILTGVTEGYLPTTVSIHGPSGTGKTLTTRRLCREFAGRTGDFAVEYVSLKECRTIFSAANEILMALGSSDARQVARRYGESEAYFFIGRGYNHPVALEGALKTKEISYEHAEGFAAGELKHGPLALVTERTPVFAVVTGSDESARKTVANVREVESRGAPVVVLTDAESDAAGYGDDVLSIPATGALAGSVLANVQLRLVSYWVANGLGRAIDKPRNLVKSVTVVEFESNVVNNLNI